LYLKGALVDADPFASARFVARYGGTKGRVKAEQR